MKIEVNLLENQKLEARFGSHTIQCDQPISNKGADEAPSPYDYFLSSIALCAGYYAKAYCLARQLDFSEIKILQNSSKDEDGKLVVELLVEIPKSFDEKNREGLLKAVDGCTVKKAILKGVSFSVR